MKKLILIALIAASLGTSGCALMLVGAGVAGGYAISKDSVRNLFDLSNDHVYDESLNAVKELGLVKLEDRTHGLIKAEVHDVDITITVHQVTKRTVELKVRGRSHLFLPKVDVAQEVYNKIIERL